MLNNARMAEQETPVKGDLAAMSETHPVQRGRPRERRLRLCPSLNAVHRRVHRPARPGGG